MSWHALPKIASALCGIGVREYARRGMQCEGLFELSHMLRTLTLTLNLGEE
jgi:hypothetical protein